MIIHKVKSILMSLNFVSSQLARISLAEFFSKLTFIELDFVCKPGPGIWTTVILLKQTLPLAKILKSNAGEPSWAGGQFVAITSTVNVKLALRVAMLNTGPTLGWPSTRVAPKSTIPADTRHTQSYATV